MEATKEHQPTAQEMQEEIIQQLRYSELQELDEYLIELHTSYHVHMEGLDQEQRQENLYHLHKLRHIIKLARELGEFIEHTRPAA